MSSKIFIFSSLLLVSSSAMAIEDCAVATTNSLIVDCYHKELAVQEDKLNQLNTNIYGADSRSFQRDGAVQSLQRWFDYRNKKCSDEAFKKVNVDFSVDFLACEVNLTKQQVDFFKSL